AVERELIPLLTLLGVLFAVLGHGEPFARDVAKILRRNFSLSFSGVRRISRSAGAFAGGLASPGRVKGLGVAVGVYAALGVAIFAVGNERLMNIYFGLCVVGVTVFVLGVMILLLFEAEGPVWA